MFVLEDIRKVIDKDSTKNEINEILDLTKKLEKKVDERYGKEKKEIVKHCISECINVHGKSWRKTSGLYPKHPLEVSLDSLNYRVDYITLTGALLHDVIEEEVDREMERASNISKNKKNKLKVKLRKKYLKKFKDEFNNFLYERKISKRSNVKNISEIVNVVDKVSRYKTEKQTYYEYLHNLFSERLVTGTRKISKKDIERSIIIKLLDRKNNIETLYAKKERPEINKLKKDYSHLLKLFRKNRLKYLWESRKGTKFNLENSLNGQKRIYNLWKNIYLISLTNDYLNKARSSPQVKIIKNILKDLIYSTYTESILNKFILRLTSSLNFNYTILLDKEILLYDEMGGLEKITEKTDNPILKYELYNVFDGTTKRYTKMIHQDEKEIKYTNKDLKAQYRDTISFERILKKLSINKDYRIRGINTLE